MFVAVSLMIFSQAWAQFPERRIQIINPWAPGDAEDIVMRKAAKHMSVELGVPVKVINHTGDRGAVGGAAIMDSIPDGYTIGILTPGPAIIHSLMRKTSHTIEDYQPIGFFLDSSFALVVRSDAPYSTLQELVTYMQQGNKVTLGTFYEFGVPALISRLIAEREGVQFSNIVVLDPVTTAALFNADVDIITLADANRVLHRSDIKILISFTNGELDPFSDIPNIKSAYNIDLTCWAGLFAPKGTPDEAMQILTRVFERALQQDDVKEFAKSSGTNIYFMNAANSKDRIIRDAELFSSILTSLSR